MASHVVASRVVAAHVVAAVAEVPPGARKRVEVAGRPVVIFNLAGEFFALGDKCPHFGGSLSHGVQIGLVRSSQPGEYARCRPGEVIKCPWHGWEFDIRTGRSFCDPAKIRARRYPVAVKSGAELGERQLSVETFPVRVEDDYLVIEA
jgi:3-phenylpropionate/trans-cinnamate dioxygenase ferredoxin subunit